MSDIGSNTQQDADKIIKEALKVWEEFGFKDIDFWETFQYDFEGFTEEDFRSASIHLQRKLRAYLQKYGVWVQKQQRYTIARSLHDVLLEEEPTPWTEAEITACEEKEEFASYQTSRLIDSDFGRKPRKSRVLTPTSLTGPPPAATLSAPAPFASPSPTSGPFALAPADIPIYRTQPSGTGPTPAAYGIPALHTSGTGPTPGAYIQPPGTGLPPAAHTPPGTGPTPAAYMQPSGTTPAVYDMQLSGATAAAYTQPTGIGATPATYATAGGYT